MIPDGYEWLTKEPGPRMLLEALKLYGITETPGKNSNPEILKWAKELGLDYDADATPWCGLFMAIVAHRAGKALPENPLRALNWRQFGTAVSSPMLGDVVMFSRDGGGHVTMYVGENDIYWYCLGGNQSDKVCVAPFSKGRIIWVRRPSYINTPANVRGVWL